MQRFFDNGKTGIMRSIALSLVFSTLFIAVSVGAATTISTNVSTGNVTASGTLGVTGLSTMVYASSTGQSLTGNLQVAGGVAVGSAMTNSLAGTILLSAQTSDPTGVTQGTFYYNSTDKVLKMYDGTDWFTVGTTTSGISLSGSRLQFSSLATQYLTLGTTTQQGVGKSMVTLEATTTTSIPLSLVGYASQTGHLLDILSGNTISGPKLLYISSSGGLFASSTGAFGGTLTVGGALTATTSAYLATTAGTVGIGTTTPATTLSVHGGGYIGNNLFVGGTITSTSSAASTIPYATTTAVTVSGTASTSVMIVGGNSISGTLAGLIAGTCDLAQASITASTTAFRNCTATAATAGAGVSTAYRVFVQATSTLASAQAAVPASNGFVIVSASSTATNIISVELSNLTGAAATPAGTLNFWAVR